MDDMTNITDRERIEQIKMILKLSSSPDTSYRLVHTRNLFTVEQKFKKFDWSSLYHYRSASWCESELLAWEDALNKFYGE